MSQEVFEFEIPSSEEQALKTDADPEHDKHSVSTQDVVKINSKEKRNGFMILGKNQKKRPSFEGLSTIDKNYSTVQVKLPLELI